MLGGLSWANRVYPLILGLPFLMAWLVGWVVVTAGIMAFILRMDRTEGLAIDRGAGEEAECGAGEGKGSDEGRGERR
jgi:hypothetical protein